MKNYYQFDSDGNVTASVRGNKAPDLSGSNKAGQVALDDPIEAGAWRYDTQNSELVKRKLVIDSTDEDGNVTASHYEDDDAVAKISATAEMKAE